MTSKFNIKSAHKIQVFSSKAHYAKSQFLIDPTLMSVDRFEYVENKLFPPTIVSISPIGGPQSGGTVVIITGSGLETTSSVTFGGNGATIMRVTDNAIGVSTPPGVGLIDVIVITDGGSKIMSNAFTYLADPILTNTKPTTDFEAR